MDRRFIFCGIYGSYYRWKVLCAVFVCHLYCGNSFTYFFTTVLFVLALLVPKFELVGILGGITFLFFLFSRKSKKNIAVAAGVFIVTAGIVMSVDYVYNKVLQEHQRTRINVLLGKDTDLKGAGYNVNQSMIAIGSGGFFGKGFLQGTQTKFDFVPE